jgi:hypothetical protein
MFKSHSINPKGSIDKIDKPPALFSELFIESLQLDEFFELLLNPLSSLGSSSRTYNA